MKKSLTISIVLLALLFVGCTDSSSTNSTDNNSYEYKPSTIKVPDEELSFEDVYDCVIKGNVGYNSGEKIYHLPGDEYYEATRIDESYGEAWFCTIEEAEQAGFRRASN